MLSLAKSRSIVAALPALALSALALSALALVGCGGLAPSDVPPEAKLTGSVTFVGGAESWPDSNVYEVRVAAFEEVPTAPDSVISAILSGRAIATDTLPKYVTQAPYNLIVPAPPRTFKYVVVAMRNGTDFFKDWVMLSVYSTVGDPSQPSTVTVNAGQTVPINFNVDFDNLPPQPFE